MFSFSRHIFLVLLFIAVYSGAIEPALRAQTDELKAEPVNKTWLIGDFLLKLPDGGLMLLQKQNDLLPASPNPCQTAKEIGYGEIVYATLDPFDDCLLSDRTLADFYAFNGTQGEQITVDMKSTVFDSYAGLANASGVIAEDNDSGGGRDARIVATLPETGVYIILANSVVRAFGDYQITLDRTPPCPFKLDPKSISVPAIGGIFHFDVITDQSCHWTAVTNDRHHVRLQDPALPNDEVMRRNGPGTISFVIDRNDNPTAYTGTISVAGTTFTVNQPALVCTYSLSTSAVSGPATGFSGQVFVSTPEGCPWNANPTGSIVSFDTSTEQRGPLTMGYRIGANYAADRVSTAYIGGQPFTVSQAGMNCTYSLPTTTFNIAAVAGEGMIKVVTQPGCFWSFSNSFQTTFDLAGGTLGPRDVTFRSTENIFVSPRTEHLTFYGGGTNVIPVTINQAGAIPQPMSVSGRVVDPNGVGLRNATVTLIDENLNTRRVTTSSFGFYTFDNVMSGYTYKFRASSKRYRFNIFEWVVYAGTPSVNFVGYE
ncbi:hypothetical protein BH10ACI2_BH10ACI2_20050 [soil metagenome]